MLPLACENDCEDTYIEIMYMPVYIYNVIWNHNCCLINGFGYFLTEFLCEAHFSLGLCVQRQCNVWRNHRKPLFEKQFLYFHNLYVARSPNVFPYSWVCNFASQGFWLVLQSLGILRVISFVVEHCRFRYW